MHHCLVADSILVRVTLEVKHEYLDRVAFTGRCRQMNRLAAHVTVSMLGHGSLCYVIIGKLVPHSIEN